MLNNLSGVTELSGGHLGFSTFLGPSSRWNYQANWGVWGKAPELTTNTCFVSKVEKDCTCHVDEIVGDVQRSIGVGIQRKLRTQELMLSNCGAGKDS